MTRIFLSALAVESRWREAFPDAVFTGEVQSCEDLVGDSVSIWVDARALSREQVLSIVRRFGGVTRVVVMSAQPDDDEGLAAVQLGAVGYCHVLAHPDQLKEIALVVEHSGVWLGPTLLQKITVSSVWLGKQISNVAPEGINSNCLAKLTSREAAVAREVGRGATNKEIAITLSVSERTVKAHLTSVFEKLSVRDRVQLALLVNDVELSPKLVVLS